MNRINHIAFFLLIFIVQAKIVSAKTLTGTVLDIEGNPVENATIYVTGNSPTLTNSSGFYSIESQSPSEDVRVEVYKENYPYNWKVLYGWNDNHVADFKPLKIIVSDGPVSGDCPINGDLVFENGGAGLENALDRVSPAHMMQNGAQIIICEGTYTRVPWNEGEYTFGLRYDSPPGAPPLSLPGFQAPKSDFNLEIKSANSGATIDVILAASENEGVFKIEWDRNNANYNNQNIDFYGISFENGTAENGGGMFVSEISQQIELNFFNCKFLNNVATNGAGFYHRSSHFSNLNFFNVTFENNNSTPQQGLIGGGGAIYMRNANLNIFNSYFNSNTAFSDYNDGFGGALNLGIDSPGDGAFCGTATNIDETFFEQNQVEGKGGGVYFEGYNSFCMPDLNINDAAFYNNYSALYGGAIQVQLSQTNITNTGFFDNEAIFGAGIYSVETELEITGSYLNGNFGFGRGTAIYLNNPSHTAKISNSKFYENSVSGCDINGCSIIYNSGSNSILKNLLVYNNYSMYSVIYGNFKVFNSTIFNNFNGDELPNSEFYQFAGSQGEIANSIFWVDDSFEPIQQIENSGLNVRNSIVKGGYPSGTNIITTDPLVEKSSPAHSSQLNFELQSISPAVNEGEVDDPDIYSSGDLDLSQNPRIFGNDQVDKIDIGAYEYQGEKGFGIIVKNGNYGWITSTYFVKGLEITKLIPPGKTITIQVDNNSSPNFSIKPLDWARVDHVLLDGTDLGTVNEVDIPNVGENHTLEVSYTIIKYTITGIITGNGSIYPTLPMQLESGADQTITFHSEGGYKVENVKVNGISKGAILSYDIISIENDVTIEVTFDECETQTLSQNYIKISDYSVNVSSPLVNYQVPDAFGRIVQSQTEFGDGRVLVQGSYLDELSRVYKEAKPFVKNRGLSYTPINMHCEDLTYQAGAYFDGTGEKPDAGGDYGYTHTIYRTDPLEFKRAIGLPGEEFSVSFPHHEKNWEFSIKEPNFISALDLNEQSLNLKKNQANPEYTLLITRDQNGNYSQQIFDKKDRVIKKWNQYDNTNQAGIAIEQVEYSPYDEPSKLIPPLGEKNSTDLKYSTAKQLIERDAPDDGLVQFRYNENGLLVFTKTNKHLKLDDPDENKDYFLINTYDPLSRLTIVCENNGVGDFEDVEITADCNGANRSVQIRNFYDYVTTNQITSLNGSFDSDEIDKTLSEVENTLGNLVAEVSYNDDLADVVDFYSYDENGSTKANYKLIPGYKTTKTTFEYDMNGNILRDSVFEYNTAWDFLYAQNYVYDEFYRISAIENKFDENDPWKEFVTYEFNEIGTLLYETYYRSDGTVVDEIYHSYNIQDWITKIQTTSGSPTNFEQNIDYSDNFNGNITGNSYKNKIPGSAASEKTLNYQYDQMNRLVGVSSTDPDFVASYSYDKNNRFLNKIEGDDSEDNLQGYKYYSDGDKVTNRLKKIQTSSNYSHDQNFVYDPEGNLVLDRSKKMTIDYNSFGMPTTFYFYDEISDNNLSWQDVLDNGLSGSPWSETLLATVTMKYNAMGMRVKKSLEANGQIENTYYVSNSLVYAEPSTGSPDLYLNYKSLNGVIGKKKNPESDNQDYFYLFDNLGTTRSVIDGNGNVVYASMYQPYGKEEGLYDDQSVKVTEKFTGKELDEEGSAENGMELYYFGARYLDPNVGYWMSTDSARQFYSLYAYVGSGQNPNLGVDSSGNYFLTEAGYRLLGHESNEIDEFQGYIDGEEWKAYHRGMSEISGDFQSFDELLQKSQKSESEWGQWFNRNSAGDPYTSGKYSWISRVQGKGLELGFFVHTHPSDSKFSDSDIDPIRNEGELPFGWGGPKARGVYVINSSGKVYYIDNRLYNANYQTNFPVRLR